MILRFLKNFTFLHTLSSHTLTLLDKRNHDTGFFISFEGHLNEKTKLIMGNSQNEHSRQKYQLKCHHYAKNYLI